MQGQLTFKVTIDGADGPVINQVVPITEKDFENIHLFITQWFARFFMVGIVDQQGNKMTAIAAKRLWEVEVEIPTILTATPGETAAVAKTKKVTL